MTSVLIVDDEMLARVGLKSIIDWETHGYRLVGEADNGEKALTMIERTHPDIVLTDAKMPVMDGVALVEECSRRGLSTRFIVLSAYGDYDYVRGALKNGAVDYLLKLELEPEALLSALRKAAVSQKGPDGQVTQLALRQRYLELLSGCDSEKRKEHIDAITQAGAPYEKYFLLSSRAWKNGEEPNENHAAELSQVLMETIGAVSSEYGNDSTFLLFPQKAVCAIISLRDTTNVQDGLQNLLRRVTETVATTLGQTLYTGISACKNDLEEISEGCEEALSALSRAERLRESFCFFSGDAERLSSAERHRTVQRVKTYVKEHLEQVVTLEDAAAYVGLSAGYLSKLFIADTAMRFTRYVQLEKVSAAKALLLTGRYRVVDIALRLGFENVTYFTKLFKSLTGYTPQAFKLKNSR